MNHGLSSSFATPMFQEEKTMLVATTNSQVHFKNVYLITFYKLALTTHKEKNDIPHLKNLDLGLIRNPKRYGY
jgi:hypothetical protein